jgi:cysteine desulfurase / selenocysteine lyase
MSQRKNQEKNYLKDLSCALTNVAQKKQVDIFTVFEVTDLQLRRLMQTFCFLFAIIMSKFFLFNGLRSGITSGSRLSMSILNDLLLPIARDDFPILKVEPHAGKKLIFLDSAASSQKPIHVLQAMESYYRTTHANVHRGAYSIANKATELFENARNSVQNFINARHREEIIFTRGASEAINLVALSYGKRIVAGDEIILTVMEHHSNIVPWQMLAERTGAKLKFVNLNSQMSFDIDHFKSLVTSRTKIVSIAHVSNVLGVINPLPDIILEARRVGAVVLLDACQSAPHIPINVQALDVDFLVASGHKMCGPTGIGFLYGKLDLLKSMPPVYGGGEMIETVTLYQSTYAPPPARFEAGTPAIAEAIGLGAACEYLTNIGMEKIFQHDKLLGKYLYDELSKVNDLIIYGPNADRTGLVAFNSKKIHPSDLSFFLDQEGVAVRTGHHCAQPLHQLLNAAGSLRASLYFYNGKQDVDDFIIKLKESIQVFENLN